MKYRDDKNGERAEEKDRQVAFRWLGTDQGRDRLYAAMLDAWPTRSVPMQLPPDTDVTYLGTPMITYHVMAVPDANLVAAIVRALRGEIAAAPPDESGR